MIGIEKYEIKNENIYYYIKKGEFHLKISFPAKKNTSIRRSFSVTNFWKTSPTSLSVILIENSKYFSVVDEKDICISLILRPLTDVIDTKPAIVEAQDYYEPSLRASSSYEILCRDETWTSDLLDESSSMKLGILGQTNYIGLSPCIPLKAKLHCMGKRLLHKVLYGLEND